MFGLLLIFRPMHIKQLDATICCVLGLFRQIVELQLELQFLQLLVTMVDSLILAY